MCTWRKYVHGVANLGSRTAKEQNRTVLYLITGNNTSAGIITT